MIKGQRLTENECQRIVEAYQKGVAVRSIAVILGSDEKTINSLLSGATYKGKYKVKEVDNRSAGKEVTMTINSKEVIFKSVRALSKALGLSECHISNIIAGREPLPEIKSIKFSNGSQKQS